MSWQDPVALSTVPSLLAACLVLVVGALLTRNVGFLARYNIPEPIVGGLLFAVGTVSGLGVQAAMATGGFRSLAAWKRCPKPVPSVPLWTAQRTRSSRSASCCSPPRPWRPG